MNQHLISILGPTASGKSALALRLARQLNGEIVSCDSMQVYRGLDIGTAKPAAADQAAVPHHLINIVSIHEPYNTRRFLSDADVVIRQIFDRDRQPILCGGTGLYARALLYGFALWPSDSEMAEKLRREYAGGMLAELRAELLAADRQLAARIGENPRHLLRALEVLRITGNIPTGQEQFSVPPYAAPEFILMPSPQLTRERIAMRTEDMLAAGWIDEVRDLQKAGVMQTPTASQALGYNLIIQYLKGSIPSLDELSQQIITATCRYAKRQRTWFRHQHPAGIMIPVAGEDTVESLTARILKLWQSPDAGRLGLSVVVE